jgi:prevent-host-death family protein
MKAASIDEVGSDFDAYVKASESGPVVVMRKGKPVAVLLPAKDDADLERLLMGHSPELQSILEAARKRFREGGGIPHEEFWGEMNSGKNKRPRSHKSRKSSR